MWGSENGNSAVKARPGRAGADCASGPKAGSQKGAKGAPSAIDLVSEVPFPSTVKGKLSPKPGGYKGLLQNYLTHLTKILPGRTSGKNAGRSLARHALSGVRPMAMQDYLSIAPEVAAALSTGAPVVALESTIITHGMPYPQNLAMAREVEDVVRANGAVPATIAIMGGMLKVGVSGDDLETLAKEGHKAAKASRRDMAALLAKGVIAGTTVATTMQIAALAGISIFATGGIGGVHRGAEDSFDISADLEELGRTPVAVVCAGAKSILDIAKTLEVLETNGVPVLGFGTDDFPAFWARQSGHKVDQRFDDAEGVARMLKIQAELGMGGVLIANPIPEADAWEASSIEGFITQALADADAQGIKGKAATPFLLQRMFELTGGKSLQSNIALVKNNAQVAAAIAVALAGKSA